MQINEITPRVKQKKLKRVGRGSSSGHGKTSTRGHKGHKSRAGRHTYIGFAGGQMRLMRKLPKIGFNIYKRPDTQVVSLEAVSKRIKKEITQVTPEVLKQAGLIKSLNKPVKILNVGKITRPIEFKGCKASKTALEKIVQAGGSLQ